MTPSTLLATPDGRVALMVVEEEVVVLRGAVGAFAAAADFAATVAAKSVALSGAARTRSAHSSVWPWRSSTTSNSRTEGEGAIVGNVVDRRKSR